MLDDGQHCLFISFCASPISLSMQTLVITMETANTALHLKHKLDSELSSLCVAYTAQCRQKQPDKCKRKTRRTVQCSLTHTLCHIRGKCRPRINSSENCEQRPQLSRLTFVQSSVIGSKIEVDLWADMMCVLNAESQDFSFTTLTKTGLSAFDWCWHDFRFVNQVRNL